MAIVYRIDANDRLCYIGEDWAAFAAENGAPELTSERVLGHSIYDFIAGKETAYVYRLLLGQARATGRPLRFPFRCDSPARRRFLTMSVRRYGDTGVEFHCTLERVESRTPISLLNVDLPRGDELVRVCSWCKRVNVRERGWHEIDAAVTELDLFSSPHPPEISHGMCNRCHDLVQSAREPA